jgi:hypothetical protein
MNDLFTEGRTPSSFLPLKGEDATYPCVNRPPSFCKGSSRLFDLRRWYIAASRSGP